MWSLRFPGFSGLALTTALDLEPSLITTGGKGLLFLEMKLLCSDLVLVFLRGRQLR